MTILVSQLPLTTIGPLQLCAPQKKAEKQRPLLAAVGAHCRGGSWSRAAHCSASQVQHGDVFHVCYLCVASLSKVLLWALQGYVASCPARVAQPRWVMLSQVRTGCWALQCHWSHPCPASPSCHPAPPWCPHVVWGPRISRRDSGKPGLSAGLQHFHKLHWET